MDQAGFEKWVRKILATEDEEISCSDCFDLVSRYVELELSGIKMEPLSQLLANHLNQCLACRDEFETLRDLTQLEGAGQMPSLDELMNSIL